MLNIFRRRTEREEALLDAVLKSPIIDQVLEQAETDNLTARRALLAQIAQHDIARPLERKSFADAAALATRQFETAQAAFDQARGAMDTARMRAGGFDGVWAGARFTLERALLETADPRLQAFAAHLANIRDNACVAALQFWVDQSVGHWGSAPKAWFKCNVDVIAKVKLQLSEAIARCHALRLQSVSDADVSEAIGQMCADLAPGLATLEINPPCLTAAHHEVGVPMTWAGASRWIVEELPTVIKAEPKRIVPPRIQASRAMLKRLA